MRKTRQGRSGGERRTRASEEQDGRGNVDPEAATSPKCAGGTLASSELTTTTIIHGPWSSRSHRLTRLRAVARQLGQASTRLRCRQPDASRESETSIEFETVHARFLAHSLMHSGALSPQLLDRNSDDEACPSGQVVRSGSAVMKQRAWTAGRVPGWLGRWQHGQEEDLL